jgi:hypothetical protein
VTFILANVDRAAHSGDFAAAVIEETVDLILQAPEWCNRPQVPWIESRQHLVPPFLLDQPVSFWRFASVVLGCMYAKDVPFSETPFTPLPADSPARTSCQIDTSGGTGSRLADEGFAEVPRLAAEDDLR